jgi:hypothetical protein
MPQKNFRAVPPQIRNKLSRIPSNEIVVGCIRSIPDLEIDGGRWRHLGIPFDPAQSSTIEVIPPDSSGKFSARNVDGEEIVRYDLPVETAYNYIEAPNWGDWSRGTHEVPLPYKRRPRDFIPPRNTPISVQLVSSRDGLSAYKFLVKEVLRKTDNKRLLECLNLLQENVGSVDVYPSDYNFQQYLTTLQISWEILPPGQRDQVMARIASGRPIPPEKQRQIDDRYNFLISLRPTQIIVGTSGMQRYLGGMIRDDLVVFENTEYGNAVYLMYDDWQQLSQRSRVELISGRFGVNFDRIVHSSGWKDRVRALIVRRPQQPS